MGFGEATQDKKVIFVEFNCTTPAIQEIQIPCFQQLIRIVGSLDEIHVKIEKLKNEKSRAWLEIEYTGHDIINNLQEVLNDALADSAMEIRRIKNQRFFDRVMSTIQEDETLDDLGPGDVFTRCLDAFDVPKKDRDELTVCYNQIIQSLQEEDLNAE